MNLICFLAKLLDLGFDMAWKHQKDGGNAIVSSGRGIVTLESLKNAMRVVTSQKSDTWSFVSKDSTKSNFIKDGWSESSTSASLGVSYGLCSGAASGGHDASNKKGTDDQRLNSKATAFARSEFTTAQVQILLDLLEPTKEFVREVDDALSTNGEVYEKQNALKDVLVNYGTVFRQNINFGMSYTVYTDFVATKEVKCSADPYSITS